MIETNNQTSTFNPFKFLFELNLIWGFMFFWIVGGYYGHKMSNGYYDCPASYKWYISEDNRSSISVLGSKSLTYYTAFCFFNPNDAGPEFSIDECYEESGWEQLPIGLILFVLWIGLLLSYDKYRKWYYLILPTTLSLIGIIFVIKFFG